MRGKWAFAPLLMAALTAAVLAAGASAGQVFKETIHEEGRFVVEDFCDEPGLDVEIAFVIDARVHVGPRGRQGLSYYMEHGKRTEVITNLANGKTVTTAQTVTDKDLRVTDNGDGTLTILILATGNFVLHGADGKALARNPGQVRVEILVDSNGTPTDPSDDEFLELLGFVKGSTGRSDDFCQAAIPVLS